METTCHRDGTITFWSVYQQVWVKRSSEIEDRELAAMGDKERGRVMRHLGIS